MTQLGFKTWMKPLKPQYMDDKTIYLYTDTDIVKNMILGRYIDLLKNTFVELTGKEYEVVITTETTAPIEPKNDGDDATFSKYTFENFIVGNSNRFAQAAALAVAESPAAAYNPLFIYGGVGLGKTHLMHAIKNYIIQNNKNAKVAFVSSETFTIELINALKDKKNEEFRAKYRSMDVLLVDDIQFIAGKTATEEEFFHTFNALKDAGSQIVLTSDRPPHEIKTLEERLRSRFEWGLICDIAPPDYETRIAILRQKAEDEKIEIDDSILSYIAERITSNIRELEGVFNRVVAYRGLVKEDITLESVMKVLKDYSNDGKSIVTPEYIVECCARFYSIPPEKFYSTSQKKDVSFARQVSFYLCKEILNISLQKIGQVFGRDHTTVLYGIKRIEKDMKTDEILRNSIEMLIKDIKSAE
ncbi:MAG: chromosomal replication initiator protein DnaA [Clostridia bacterium]|nr:chromosomal replication initiator protein DnaA [Clostridia bacterium]